MKISSRHLLLPNKIINSMAQFYRYEKPFELECGAVLPSLTIAYDTFGELNADKSNVIWVCHALTANSDVADWWPHTVEEGCFLDPAKYFTVCANFLGSHYGTTGPLSVNPATGEPWYGDFPLVTVRDMVRAHQVLAEHLGINCVKLLIGSSIGGFQCLEWRVMQPDFAEKAEFISKNRRFIDERLISDIAVSLDITADEGELSERIDAVIGCLNTMSKYECGRLR